jgi:hypothetical protein
MMRERVPEDPWTLPTAGAGERASAAFGGITLTMVRESFAQWRIFGRPGQWWAVRGGPLALSGPESLLLRAITARDLTELAERLCLQHRLDQLDAQELAAVHRDMALPGPPG